VRLQSTWGRRTFTALLASGVAMGAATFTTVTPASAEPVVTPVPAAEPAAPKEASGDTLGSRDVELLAEAEGRGDRKVTVIIATDKGEAGDVAAAVRKLGGTVTRQFDKVGYVLAEVPTAKVKKTAALNGIAALDLDDEIKLGDPTVEQAPRGAKQAATLSGPDGKTPAANPYMPTNEIGAVDFKKKHPTWDGRGITIGIMDSGIDLDHPALQTTTTGARKIVDWVTATDPVLDNDGTWRPMTTDAVGPTFTFADATWTAPAGNWKVASFTEAITEKSEPEGDVNRDGDTTDVFGILFDPKTNDVRVDANQNLDFTDDAVMRPYKEKFDVGHFGVDDPKTGVAERMPFVVEFRKGVPLDAAGTKKVDFVNIGIVEGMHGTHVAGITAANDMLGNVNFDGEAPGAKLVSARACSWGGGCTNAALTTGMVDLVQNRKVDVINMSIGGLNPLNDGSDAQSVLYNRLINDYGVQIFVSAGNSGPGLNTVGSPSTSPAVVSVAASVSKATWLSNYGAVVRKENALFNFSSRGPNEDGNFKPNLTAPGSAISSAPLWQEGDPVPEAGYPLPAGYAMANGTSMSSPQAAGGAALLLSAAEANDTAVTPAALRRVLYTSAKPIPETPTYGQGNGQMDVNGAWALLAKPVPARKYTASAPVCTPISSLLQTPNVGTGLYNRCGAADGGHQVGQAKKYTVKLTRTSGATRDITHTLKWLGNDGTFTTAKSVVLPLNKTVSVTVTATPKVGAHSAILRVDDPGTAIVDFEVLATVVAANTPAKPAYGFAAKGSVDRNSTVSYFIDVPVGATALQVNLSGLASGSQVRFIGNTPWGLPVESTSSLECYTNFSDASTCKPIEREYQNPTPGIWELEVEARRTTPAMSNPFELSARVQGVTVDPSIVTLPSVAKGVPSAVTWTVKNQFGPLVVSGKGGPLGSALVSRPTVAHGKEAVFEVDVPAGATSLDVAINNPSDLAADLDLVVLLGDKEIASDADGDSDEKVSIANPKAGTYTVVVAGYSVPAGTTTFDYRDVYYTPGMGTVAASTAKKSLAAGGTTTIAGSVTAGGVTPAVGRSLYGEMTVLTEDEAVVGRGAVVVGEVK
jgi:subtilisin family serine protease